MIVSRRSALIGIGAGIGGFVVLPKSALAAAALPPTPQETMGPFYPVNRLAEDDADLAHLAGHSARAKGELIELYGTVRRPDGSPVANASLAVWQANAAGRYRHPLDHNTAAPLDPDFQGFGQLKTGHGGDYCIVTVKPAPYPAANGTTRAPHIHFDVADADYRLVTQMYFPGERLNETDFLRSTMSRRMMDPALLTCARADAHIPGATGFRWDIVLL